MNLLTNRIKINRNELSGAFGDIGTDLPLIVAMLAVTDLNASGVLIIFGLMQVMTAFVYGLPMPVQPLKAVAMIVITQKISSDVIFGGGLAIGVVMLLLTVTGMLTLLNRLVPKTVVRGIQLGLGLQLCLLALTDYIPSDQYIGYVVAAIGFAIGVVLIGNKKYPPALFIIGLGFLYALISAPNVFQSISVTIPTLIMPKISIENVLTGFVLLALPQIPLSLGNSIFATNQLVNDYFPEKKMTVKKIGLTYSIINIVTPFVGGIPTCHGSGGIAGHYTFGGRTGGSALIYGLFYIMLGLLFSMNLPGILMIFPKPILGVILLFEGIALVMLVKDIITEKKTFFIAILVGIMAIGLPYGYLIGMVTGTVIFYLPHHYVLKHYGKH